MDSEIIVRPYGYNYSARAGGKGGAWHIYMRVGDRKVYLRAKDAWYTTAHGRGHAINRAKWYSERTGIPWRMWDDQ